MPCQANCDLKDLLLAKEVKISRLQQVKQWIDALYRQEPHCRDEIIAKKSVVTNQIVQALAKAGVLVQRLANSCNICNAL